MARSSVAPHLDLVTTLTIEIPPRVKCHLETGCGHIIVDKSRPVADQAAAEAWAASTGLPAAEAAAAGGCLWHETATPDCYTGGG